jgi:RNA polymerase sigma factor (sigma-70 family)
MSGPEQPEAVVDGEDAELLSAAARGDARAMGALVDRYQRLVYAVPKRLGLPPEACEDVFQNVFVALIRHVGSIRDARTLPKWLITTANRESWSAARVRRRHRGVEPPEALAGDVPPPAEGLEDLEIRQQIERALQALGGRCEKLLRAVMVAGDRPDYQRLGQELGMPVGSIGPTRARCLEKLQALMSGPEGGA